MNKSICAVVVTYNRKQQLLACLNALKKQSYTLAHIVVVNNASQDGTEDFLAENNWINNDYFTLINLNENLGGAGGFYIGIEFALSKNTDFVWLMDDDGLPQQDCLSHLIPYAKGNSYIGPVVLDINGSEKLSFTLRKPNSLDVVKQYSELDKDDFIQEAVLPFNGTLISTSLIKEMGLPNKDFFIWGDEREYTFRAEKYNAEIGTVTKALFYHPIVSSQSVPMFFGHLHYNYTDSKLKQYCFSRNTFAIFHQYKGLFYALAFATKVSWFYLFTQPNLKALYLNWKAIWHGFTRDFSHHKAYLTK